MPGYIIRKDGVQKVISTNKVEPYPLQFWHVQGQTTVEWSEPNDPATFDPAKPTRP